MKKLLPLIAINLSFAGEIYFIHTNHAFRANQNSILFEYQKVNDTIDIFNVKKSELKNTSFNAIGDLDGGKITLILNNNDNQTLISSLQREDIDYGDKKLINYTFNLHHKYTLFQTDNKAFSFDSAIIVNKGNKLFISNPSYLSSLAKRFFDVKNVAIKDNLIAIEKKDGTTQFLHLTNNPSIDIDNLKDYTFSIGFNIEKRYNNLFFDVLSNVKYTKIYTDIKANIQAADENTQKTLDKYDLNKNLDRDEKSLEVGFNITYKSFIVTEFSYLYRYIFRSSDLDYIKYNHIINLDFSKDINKQITLFVGGKLMYRQFNGEIPYLYNKYSQTTFDHKYGFAKVGIKYKF